MPNNKILLILLLFSCFGRVDAEQISAEATFAGGCFWCMEPPFDKLPGVLKTTTGYTGGTLKNPGYEQVSRGNTEHYEAIRILYDPAKISYQQLLQVFWKNIDPTDDQGQFCDKGSQYRSAIFYHDDQQRRLAENAKTQLQQNKPFPGAVKTEIIAAGPFYPAEAYHQNYYQKNPLSYKFYRFTCGRDKRLTELWGKSK